MTGVLSHLFLIKTELNILSPRKAEEGGIAVAVASMLRRLTASQRMTK